MKRCIFTMRDKNEVPLFDLVVYGVTAAEVGVDPDGARARIEVALRKRDMSLDDFDDGIPVRDPSPLPANTVPHVPGKRVEL